MAGVMMSGEEFIKIFEKNAASIKDNTKRSKKYRAGVAILALKAIASNDITYLEAAIRFTNNIIDEHDRSKAYVDIVRGTSRVARITANPDLVRRALEISAKTIEGHDRSHAMEGVVSTIAEVGLKNNESDAIENAIKLAEGIEYDTYRSSSLRKIAMTLHAADNNQSALDSAIKALDIIDSSNSITNPIYRTSAYIDLSKLFLDLDQIDAANNCIKKADESANSLINEFERSSIYQSIVETRLILGARTKNRIHFQRAVTSFGQITREYYRTFTMQKLKNILIKFNEEELIDSLT
ncbi:MAG: hypothetical protein IBX40_04190 [Methanosarcinales archaeon]|nr:hypothetical protein [Methanosarcinales archaeon]